MPKPSPTPKSVRPVQSLRKHCTAFEAASGLVLKKPGKKPVHQLRTSSRRIEAQLEILRLLESSHPQLRAASRSAHKLIRLLSAVRKAAGKVRDCDVQREILRDAAQNSEAGPMHQDALHLRRTLEKHRDKAASSLVRELTGHAHKLAPRLEKLLDQLEPAQDITVASSHLSTLIEDWYSQHNSLAASSADSLHGVRKAAKLARYMAESAGLPTLAASLERLQQLGGIWHDALTLRKTVRNHLGRKSALLAVLAAKEQAALESFEQSLG